ncbi:hypothetical protein V8E52_001752 [Russula decolorans]
MAIRSGVKLADFASHQIQQYNIALASGYGTECTFRSFREAYVGGSVWGTTSSFGTLRRPDPRHRDNVSAAWINEHRYVWISAVHADASHGTGWSELRSLKGIAIAQGVIETAESIRFHEDIMMRAQLIIDFTASRWLSLLLQGCNDHFVSATALSMMDAQESGCYVQQTSSNTTKITVPETTNVLKYEIYPIGDGHIAKTLYASSMESGSKVINKWDIPAMTTSPESNTSALHSCSSSGPFFRFPGDIDE